MTCLLAGLWTLVVLYVIVDVRRVMAFNNRANRRVFGKWDFPITPRSVLINRIALGIFLVLGNWAIFCLFGPFL